MFDQEVIASQKALGKDRFAKEERSDGKTLAADREKVFKEAGRLWQSLLIMRTCRMSRSSEWVASPKLSSGSTFLEALMLSSPLTKAGEET